MIDESIDGVQPKEDEANRDTPDHAVSIGLPWTPATSPTATLAASTEARPGYKFYTDRDALTLHGGSVPEDVMMEDLGPVPPAVAEDAKRRLVEDTLFRNGIVSYRIPEWDPGHIDRGVKYRYVTEAMVSAAPPIPSYRNELAAAISAGTALPLKADGSAFAPDESVKAPTAEEIAEAVAYLVQAKERMAANALSDVGYFIGRAIQLLEG